MTIGLLRQSTRKFEDLYRLYDRRVKLVFMVTPYKVSIFIKIVSQELTQKI